MRSSADKQASRHLKDILDHMSPSTCRIGFWTSDVIMSDTQFPQLMRKPLVWKSSPTSSSTTTGKVLPVGTFDRNVMCIVEIWSKNPRLDAKNRLIARQIQHYNVFMEPEALQSDWLYGGKKLESPVGSFEAKGPSLISLKVATLENPNRRNDKLNRPPAAVSRLVSGYRYLSYPIKPSPFNTWMSPAVVAQLGGHVSSYSLSR